MSDLIKSRRSAALERSSKPKAGFLVLADDLTGALEAGAKFAAQGVRALVMMRHKLKGLEARHVPTVLVIDTETRHVSAGAARRTIRKLASAAPSLGFNRIYKKTDSTLRGNIASEFEGLMSAWPGSSVLYVPTYPRMGRTVSGGVLRVAGVPVACTAFGVDNLNPVAESHIPTLLGKTRRMRVVSVKPETLVVPDEPGVCVCDGESAADVRKVARFFASSSAFALAAGPAAFLHQLARLDSPPHGNGGSLPPVRSALIVSGSRHPASLAQLQQAEQRGIQALESAAVPSRPSTWFILKSSSSTRGSKFARQQAKDVLNILRRAPFDALIVFGGDTASTILRALGDPHLRPVGEVMEGVPLATISRERLAAAVPARNRQLVWVSKAGGFGLPGAILSMRRILRRRQS